MCVQGSCRPLPGANGTVGVEDCSCREPHRTVLGTLVSLYKLLEAEQ